MDIPIREEGKFKFIEEGNGHTIIVLHGLFGALSNFTNVIKHFSKNYQVVVPILPIYDLLIINTNVSSLAKFVHKFIEFKGYKDFTLLGNSLGGHVGLVYSKNHPEKVHSLVLTGSSGLYEDTMGGTFPKRENYDFVREKVEYTFYDPINATKELVDECYDLVNDRNKLLKILALAKSAIRHNMAEDLPNLKMPSCLIWGKNDKITPQHVAEEFHSLLPNSELLWIDKCGHAPMMERPEEFNGLLSKWLENLLKPE